MVGGLPTDATPAVVPLAAAGRREAAALLARAFAADPLWTWIVPGAGRRASALPWLFERLLGDQREVLIETTEAELAGLAIWVPPSTAMSTARVRTVFGTLVRLRGDVVRLARYAGAASNLEGELGSATSWRLGGIAVDPGQQGRGIGSALLRTGLARADEAGERVILVTSSPSNVPFYERHGFTVAVERPLPETGPPAWGMVRRPRASA